MQTTDKRNANALAYILWPVKALWEITESLAAFVAGLPCTSTSFCGRLALWSGKSNRAKRPLVPCYRYGDFGIVIQRLLWVKWRDQPETVALRSTGGWLLHWTLESVLFEIQGPALPSCSGLYLTGRVRRCSWGAFASDVPSIPKRRKWELLWGYSTWYNATGFNLGERNSFEGVFEARGESFLSAFSW